MDCNKAKHSYHFNISEVEDNKVKEVMHFNFGGHHDLKQMAENTVALGTMTEKHAKELAVAVRLLHHVIKKYPENAMLKAFAPAFEEFKKEYKESICQCAKADA